MLWICSLGKLSIVALAACGCFLALAQPSCHQGQEGDDTCWSDSEESVLLQHHRTTSKLDRLDTKPTNHVHAKAAPSGPQSVFPPRSPGAVGRTSGGAGPATRPRNFKPAPLCGSQEDCLAILDKDLLQTRPRQTFPGGGLLQTMSPSLGGGPCGALCDLTAEPTTPAGHDTYDNAVAAIYLVKRKHLAAAETILNVFLKLLYPADTVACATAVIGKASGKRVVLLAASYTNEPAQACEYTGPGVLPADFQGNVITAGNNAWVGLAFAHYAAAAGSQCHATVARDILGALFENKCGDQLQGVMGLFKPVSSPTYRSIEHNVDIFALADMLGDQEVRRSTATFIQKQYGSNAGAETKGAYGPGTRGASKCDTQTMYFPTPLDAQVWNFLAQADPVQERGQTSLQFVHDVLAEKDVDSIGLGTEVSGFRFANGPVPPGGHGVQWEVTTGGAMALIRYKELYPSKPLSWLQGQLDAVRNSVRYLLSTYGLVPGSVLGGNYDAYMTLQHGDLTDLNYPGGSASGFGYTYLRYGHLASTSWSGLLLLMQFDGTQTVNADANPYATPSRGIPAAGGSLQCIPGNLLRDVERNTSTTGPAATQQPECRRRRAKFGTKHHPLRRPHQ